MVELDLFGEPVLNGHKSVLAQTFSYPPFSVLNAREGWWQERKRQWLALGIKSEVGRGANALQLSEQCEQCEQYRTASGDYVKRSGGGLTWGNSPQVTEKGLNYYRKRNATAQAPAAAESRQSTEKAQASNMTPPPRTVSPAPQPSTHGTASQHGKRTNGGD